MRLKCDYPQGILGAATSARIRIVLLNEVVHLLHVLRGGIRQKS